MNADAPSDPNKTLEVTIDGKEVSPEVAKKVKDALKATLLKQLKEEADKMNAGEAENGDVGSHGRW